MARALIRLRLNPPKPTSLSFIRSSNCSSQTREPASAPRMMTTCLSRSRASTTCPKRCGGSAILPCPKHPRSLHGEVEGSRRLPCRLRQRRRQPASVRLQCFDFQGINNKQYADLIEPLMVWILRRIDEIVYDPKNLGVPKHVLIEEIFSNMKNKQLLEGALASIKTVRKNLGGVTMIGQSANDLGENADSIVNSCTSFLFLAGRDVQPPLLRRAVQAEWAAAGPVRESASTRGGFTSAVTGSQRSSRSTSIPAATPSFRPSRRTRVRRSKLIEMYGLHEGIERFAQGETA